MGQGPDASERDAMTCCNACTSWKQLLVADQAYVTAQATKWKDATSVTVSFSHIAGDAFTIKSILEAWQGALNGQPPEALQELGKDPFVKLLPQEGEKEQLPLGWAKLGLVRKFKLITSMLWEIKVRRPDSLFKQYYIYMPQAKLDELMQQARRDLDQLAAAASHDEKLATRDYTVSTFNVLLAWLLQNTHAAHPRPRKRSTVLTIVNAKRRPPLGHVPGDYPAHPLWGAALAAVLPSLPARDYATLPLGHVALHIRESLKQQVTPENMRDSLRMMLKHTMRKKPSGELVYFTKSTGNYWQAATEWRSAKFGEIDFKAAKDAERREAEKVQPVAMNAYAEIPVTARNRWVIFGEAGKGVWFSGGLTDDEASSKDGFGRYIKVK